MELPPEATRMGATPRWMGYVGVDDVDVTADQFRQRGGAVYVPPVNSNIGRISVVADPQAATMAVVTGLKYGQRRTTGLDQVGHVGWHELLAADAKSAFAFYAGLFGWQKAGAQPDAANAYRMISVGDIAIGGVFTKPPEVPVPAWLYYFNIGDVEAAAKRAKSAGGKVMDGPIELPGGNWIVRCADPQGAVFALQGERSRQGVGWSTEWEGFSSKGRVIGGKRGA